MQYDYSTTEIIGRSCSQLAPSTMHTNSLEQQTQTLHRLNEIHRAILKAQSPHALAQVVLNKLDTLLPYPLGIILVPDVRRAAFVVMAAAPASILPVNQGMLLPYSELPPGQFSADGKLVQDVEIIPDLSLAVALTPFQQNLVNAGIRGCLRLPLTVAEQLIGILDLFAEIPLTPVPSQVETARQLADSLAIALHHVRLYEQVNTTRERLLALSHRQLELKEQERRQMNRALHDLLGQDLTGLNINLHHVARNLPADTPESARARLADSCALLEQVIANIRNLMSELRPPILDDLGLYAALRWYTGDFSKRTEIPIFLDAPPAPVRLPPLVETALFRITQEALTNVVKHARATRVNISLDTQCDTVTLVIADNGAGFDFPAMRRNNPQSGVGLVDMRERAEAVGGTIWVETQPGQGTMVIIKVPVNHDYSHSGG